MRKRIIAILLGLLSLALLAALIVQIVLWSDYPRRAVVRELEIETGLRVSAQKLSTGWFGRTTLHDVAFALPLDDPAAAPLLHAVALDVRHRALLPLLLGGDLDLESVQVRGGRVELRQTTASKWNLLEALHSIRDAQQAGETSSSGPARLPQITLHDATIAITSAAGAQSELAGVNFEGKPASAHVWEFQARAPDTLEMQGQLVTSGAWRHRASFTLERLDDLLHNTFEITTPAPLTLTGQWQGHLNDDELVGRLELSEFQADQTFGSGAAQITISAQEIIASGLQAELRTPAAMLGQTRILDGAVRLRDSALTAQGLRLHASDAIALANVAWDMKQRTGELEATWTSQAPAIATSSVVHHGTLRAHATLPVVGQQQLRAVLTSEGQLQSGSWQANIEAQAMGLDWSSMRGSVRAPTLMWRDAQRTIDVGGFTAQLASDWPSIHVTDFQLPGASAGGAGRMNLQSRTWELSFAAERWRVPGLEDAGPLNLRASASGDEHKAELHAANLSNESLDVALTGTYQRDAQPPLRGSTQLREKSGRFAGEFAIQGQVRPLSLQIAGHLSGADVPSIERAQAQLRAAGGLIHLDDVQLYSGQGSILGRANFNPSTQRLALDAVSADWPVTFSAADAHVLINARAHLEFDLAKRTGSGGVDLDGRVTMDQRDLGPVLASITLDQRTIQISHLRATLLDGTLWATGSVPWEADQIHASRGEIVWQDLDPSTLAMFWLPAKRFNGRVSGAAVLAPADDRRALEPMKLDLAIHSHDATFDSISLGNAHLTAYLGPKRLLLQQSQFDVAGGRMNLWGRLSRHKDETSAHLHANFRDLSFAQLAPMLDKDAGEVTGHVSGDAAVGGYLRAPHRMFGQAQLALSEMDMANLPVISLLYQTLNLQFGRPEPSGYGQATFRLEGNALEMSRFEYFNRGTDVVGRVRIEDIWRGAESPIDGVAIGAVRPLKNLDLPFFKDLDRALAAVQTDTASVRISGTLGERDIRAVPFAEIRGMLRAILGSP